MKRRWLIFLFAGILLQTLLAQAADTKEAKIKRAVAVSLPDIVMPAKVVDMNAQGKMTVLRDGRFYLFSGDTWRGRRCCDVRGCAVHAVAE
jgi:hypothetical protein